MSKPFKCDICGKRFADRYYLVSHLHVHSTDTPFACPKCPYKGKTKKYLSRHTRQVHKERTNEHKCNVCGKLYLNPSNLKVHAMVHSGEKPHRCKVCGKTFRVTYSLNSHMLIHTNEKPFQCSFCDYACRDSSTLRKHQYKHMGMEKIYECTICNKGYKSKRALKIHISETHLNVDVMKYPCGQCDKVFKSNGHRTMHINVLHKRALVCNCPICGRRIMSKHNLAAHMRTHLDERPFSCTHPGCKLTFKDKGSLCKHSVIHNPEVHHPCKYCGRKFARKAHLKRHERVMHVERRRSVECHYCGSKFYSKNYLIKHIQTKHIYKQKFKYICDICGLITHNKPSIVMHLKYGHSNDHDLQCKICDTKTVYKRHTYLKMHYWKTHNIRYKITRPSTRVHRDETEKPAVEVKVEPIEADSYEGMQLFDVQKQEIDDDIVDESLDYSKRVLSEDIADSVLRNREHTKEVDFDEFFIRHVFTKQEDKVDDESKNYDVNEEQNKRVKDRIKQILIKTQKLEKAKALRDKRKKEKIEAKKREKEEAKLKAEKEKLELIELRRVRDMYNERMKSALIKEKNKKEQVKIKYFKKNIVCPSNYNKTTEEIAKTSREHPIETEVIHSTTDDDDEENDVNNITTNEMAGVTNEMDVENDFNEDNSNIDRQSKTDHLINDENESLNITNNHNVYIQECDTSKDTEDNEINNIGKEKRTSYNDLKFQENRDIEQKGQSNESDGNIKNTINIDNTEYHSNVINNNKAQNSTNDENNKNDNIDKHEYTSNCNIEDDSDNHNIEDNQLSFDIIENYAKNQNNGVEEHISNYIIEDNIDNHDIEQDDHTNINNIDDQTKNINIDTQELVTHDNSDNNNIEQSEDTIIDNIHKDTHEHTNNKNSDSNNIEQGEDTIICNIDDQTININKETHEHITHDNIEQSEDTHEHTNNKNSDNNNIEQSDDTIIRNSDDQTKNINKDTHEHTNNDNIDNSNIEQDYNKSVDHNDQAKNYNKNNQEHTSKDNIEQNDHTSIDNIEDQTKNIYNVTQKHNKSNDSNTTDNEEMDQPLLLRRVKNKKQRPTRKKCKKYYDSGNGSDEEVAGKSRKMEFKTFQCYICFKLYQTKQELINHCQEHFDICHDRTLAKCPMCDHVSYKGIADHMKRKHDITVKIPFNKIKDRKNEDGSRYCYDVDGTIVEVIPSIGILNKTASDQIDKKRRDLKDKSIAKSKLVRKGNEWIVEKEAIDIQYDEFPDLSDKELNKCKITDNDVDRLGQLSCLARKKGLKMMFPCFKCDKICQNFSALKLHKRRHEDNPTPFKPRGKKIETKKIKLNKSNRTALPKPIKSNHKCDEKLKKFFESNIRGEDIEFWQFLKIFNKMDREKVNDFQDLEERSDFGNHLDYYKDVSESADDNEDICTSRDVVKRKVTKKRKKGAIKNYK